VPMTVAAAKGRNTSPAPVFTSVFGRVVEELAAGGVEVCVVDEADG
jgi:hypothetical protein